jgi:hypothetical protein
MFKAAFMLHDVINLGKLETQQMVYCLLGHLFAQPAGGLLREPARA